MAEAQYDHHERGHANRYDYYYQRGIGVWYIYDTIKRQRVDTLLTQENARYYISEGRRMNFQDVFTMTRNSIKAQQRCLEELILTLKPNDADWDCAKKLQDDMDIYATQLAELHNRIQRGDI